MSNEEKAINLLKSADIDKDTGEVQWHTWYKGIGEDVKKTFDIAIRHMQALEQESCDDLCKSCDTKGCIFQSGIKREKCDFYTSKKCGMSDEQVRTVIDAFTCEDAISRAYIEPLVEELENICINGDEHVLDILSNIKNAPSVTPQQKVGKWIKSSIGGAKVCSICQAHMGLSNFKYCPNCGAKMDVNEEDY